MKPRFYTSKPPWVTLLWWLDRWRGWCFAGLALIYAAGVNGRWRITSDSAWYVWQARAMDFFAGAAGGVGQSGRMDVGLGATPPGLPMAIAAVGGSPGWGTTCFMLALAGVVLGLTYQLFKEHADRPTATLMVVLVGLSGLFYEMSFGLLTELPFAAGLLLMLWGHERRLKRKNGLWLALAMMLAGVLWMAMFRSVVAVVIGAYVLAEVIRVVARPDQRRLGLALIGLAVAGAVVLWGVSSAVRDDAGFLVNGLKSKTLTIWSESFRGLMTEALPEAVFGQDVPPLLAWPASVMVVVSSLLLVRARLLWGVLVGVMLLQWVVFLSDDRYVLPVLGLVLFGVWRCGVGLLEKWKEPWRGLGFGIGALALVGTNVSGVVNTIGEQRSGDFYETYRGGKYAAVVELAQVVRQQTPEDARLMGGTGFTLELVVLARRHFAGFDDDIPSHLRPSVFLIGVSEAAAEWIHPNWDRLGPVKGSAVDRRSGEVWEVREVERVNR